ncbi:MAG: STAS domain-containing protein [Chitinivibrionales bacterium]|nr:STAS domain-containing protein [Chitinivibrionales bacterium]
MGDKQERLVYKFGEKIYIGNTDNLAAVLSSYIESKDPSTVIFDLENVRLCDSYGLRLFINYHRKLSDAGKRLVFYRPDPIIREIFESVKLTRVFTIVDSPDAID